MASVHLDVIIETLPRWPRGRWRRTGAPRVALVLAVLAGLMGGCANPIRRAEHAAERRGFTRLVLPGAGYNHVAFASHGTIGGPLLVFIEGDGSPWVPGSEAADPTSRSPLALALALETPARRVLYLGRPCYLGRAALDECTPPDWTGGRYGTRIVASLCAAIDHYTVGQPAKAVLLIGVSGGGTLSSTTTTAAKYTAPSASSSAVTVTVTATSIADTTKTAGSSRSFSWILTVLNSLTIRWVMMLAINCLKPLR